MLPDTLSPVDYARYYTAPAETLYSISSTGPTQVALTNLYRTHLWFAMTGANNILLSTFSNVNTGTHPGLVLAATSGQTNIIRFNIWDDGPIVQLAWYSRGVVVGAEQLVVFEQFLANRWPVQGKQRIHDTLGTEYDHAVSEPLSFQPGTPRRRNVASLQPHIYRPIRDTRDASPSQRFGEAYSPPSIPTLNWYSLDKQRRYNPAWSRSAPASGQSANLTTLERWLARRWQ